VAEVLTCSTEEARDLLQETNWDEHAAVAIGLDKGIQVRISFRTSFEFN